MRFWDSSARIETSIKGLISLKNGTITLSGSNAALTNCATVLKIDNTDIYLDTLTCSVAGHPITVSARAKNVVALVGDNPNAPETNPAISTNSIVVGIIFLDFSWTDNLDSLSSGTGTTPTFGSIVANG